MAITAVYVATDKFSVTGDQTAIFITGRRVKCDCGVDGIKYGTILSSSFGTFTTVTLTTASDNLTSNLTGVFYGIVGGGAADQSIPEHAHDGNEGEGGLIDVGPIKQLIRKQITTQTSFSANYIAPDDIGIDNTDGNSLTTQAITLTDASNEVRLQGRINFAVDNDAAIAVVLLVRGTTALAIIGGQRKKDFLGVLSFDYYDAPGSVGPHTYDIRVATKSNTLYINQDKNNDDYDNLAQEGSWITLTEVDVS